MPAVAKNIPSLIQMIAIDMDGTLLTDEGQVSPRNLAALRAAESAGVQIVIATGRRHCFAMRVLSPLDLPSANALISSNGTVTRTIGSASATAPIASQLIAHSHLPLSTTLWLCKHIDEFRNALVLTFDRTGSDGEDSRGALVVEHLDELTSSITRWMTINAPYIAHINPIERSLDPIEGDRADANLPIQAMLCGTIERMARAEARLLEHPGVSAYALPTGRTGRTMLQPPASDSPKTAPSIASSTQQGEDETLAEADKNTPIITLHRTEYPARDLTILDILPANCSKGAALLALAKSKGIAPAQIMAIGDNWNDLSMLQVAGRAVLMNNAPEDLKSLARSCNWSIGPSNQADGVAQAIESVLSIAVAFSPTT